jgi:hypothetical protein
MLILTMTLTFVTIFLSGAFCAVFFAMSKRWQTLVLAVGMAFLGIYNLISLIGIASGA